MTRGVYLISFHHINLVLGALSPVIVVTFGSFAIPHLPAKWNNEILLSKRLFFAYINATTWLTYQWLFNPVVASFVAVAIVSSVSLLLSTPSLISLWGKLAYISQHELYLSNILSSLWLLLPWHFVLMVSCHLLMFELAVTNTILC